MSTSTAHPPNTFTERTASEPTQSECEITNCGVYSTPQESDFRRG